MGSSRLPHLDEGPIPYISFLVALGLLLYQVNVFGLASRVFQEAVITAKVRWREAVEHYGSESPGTETHNATLGFGEVMFISREDRTDRQDGMYLLASTTGVQLTHIVGVDGSTLSPKERPPGSGGRSDPEMGCWRSHANAWRRVLDQNIDTALILEDDVDWDVDVHSILSALSEQLQKRNPLSNEEDGNQKAPFTLDWDVIWLGQCLHKAAEDGSDGFVAYEDAHMPLHNQMDSIWRDQLVNYNATTSSRVVAKAHEPLCLMGYAVTKRGAQKLLYQIGYSGTMLNPVDVEMLLKTRDGHLSALVVIPPVINTWRVGDGRDSDIQKSLMDKGENGRGMGTGWSRNLRKSGRRGLEELGAL